MKIKTPLFLIIAVSFFCACTSTKMDTQKLGGYNEKIESLVVSTLFSEYFEKASTSFIDGIESELQSEGILVEYYPYPEIKNDSLDPKIQTEIILNRILMKGLEFETSHALFLIDTEKKTESISFGTTTNTTNTHSLRGLLIDINKELVVWQADIKLKSGDFGNSNQSGTSLAKNTIDQLREDNFLKPAGYTITRKSEKSP